MTTLHVVIDPSSESTGGRDRRYSLEIARALVETAPRDCIVAAMTPAVTDAQRGELHAAVPGLESTRAQRLASRELSAQWRFGVGVRAHGLVHSPTLLAPLGRHTRESGTQLTVTVHDLLAWTAPASLARSDVAWTKAMMRRASRYADAVIVPSHALADQLLEIVDLGDRVRVIPGAGQRAISTPDDADARADRLELPDRFVVVEAEPAAREELIQLLVAMDSEKSNLPIIVLGTPLTPEELAQLSSEAHARLLVLPELDDIDRCVVIGRALVYVSPARTAGFGAPILDALALGTSVIHSDAPALVELTGDSSVVVALRGDGSYGDRLAKAVGAVAADVGLRSRLRVAGMDRARAYSWRDAAERIWQLHADL